VIKLVQEKGEKVSKKEAKRDKPATKTLKNSNKQQQTQERGSEVVQSPKMLPGMGPSKVVAEWKGVPALF
jgi:hypothetical protein